MDSLSEGRPQRLKRPIVKDNERQDFEQRTKKRPLTKKEKNERYREKLKADSEAYELFKLKERERAKKYRQRKRSTEQISHERELNRLRSKQYRERQKLINKSPPSSSNKVKTRKDVEKETERRERNRLSAQKMRNSYSKQKLAAVRKKRRDRYWAQKADSATNVRDLAIPTEKEAGPFPSETAFRSALKRARKEIKGTGQRFAKVIKGLIQKADTPTKKALRNEDICTSPSTIKLKERVQDQVDSLKCRRDKTSIIARRNLLGILNNSTANSQQDLYSRRKTTMKSSVQDFLEEEAIDLPGKDNFSKRMQRQKKIMPSTVKTAHKKFSVSSQKVVSLRSFYRYRARHIMSVTKTKFRQCLCEVCYNPGTKLAALNPFLSKKLDMNELLEMTMCPKPDNSDFQKLKCIKRDCEDCGVKLWTEQLKIAVKENLAVHITFAKWESVELEGKKRMEKLKKKKTVGDTIDELGQELGPLSLHLFNSQWQRGQFNVLKENLPMGQALMVMDFAENYLCKTQDEAQSAYWGYRQVTVHPIVTYLKCQFCHDLVTMNLVFLTNDLKHDSHAVNVFFKESVSYVSTFQPLERVYIYSDGAGSQYKSKLPFFYLTQSSVPAEKVFFGSRHGKNPCDALGGTVKSLCSRLVASTDNIINDADSMYQACQRNFEINETGSQGCSGFHKTRKFFIIKPSDIDRTSDSGLKTVPGTRSIHHVRSLSEGVIATRKLACFCDHCLNSNNSNTHADSDGSNCKNKAHVEEWDIVKMVVNDKNQSILNEAFCQSNVEVEENHTDHASNACDGINLADQDVPQAQTDSSDSDRVHIGSFYMMHWQGKTYVCQVMEKDLCNDVVHVKFMSWRNGRLCWGNDDFSWENLDDIGSEVRLSLDEKASTQRTQLYTYSFVM